MRRAFLLLLAGLALTACGKSDATKRYEARQVAIKAAEQSPEALRAAGRAMVVMRPIMQIECHKRDYNMMVTYAQVNPPEGQSRYHAIGAGINLSGLKGGDRNLFPEYASESLPAGSYYFSSATGRILVDNVTPKRFIMADYKLPSGKVAELISGLVLPDLVLEPGEIVFLGDLVFSGSVCDKSSIRLRHDAGDLSTARAALQATNPALAPELAQREFRCALCKDLEK